MAEEPQQLREDIEDTRDQLAADLDALSDRVSPSSVAHRQVDRARAGVAGVKDRIMGSAHDAVDGARGGVASSSDVAGSAVDRARRRTQGNPLAAGVVAFGAGLLLASLFPAADKEKEALAAVADPAKEKGRQLLDEVRGPAQEVGASLGEHAKEAAAQVKDAAQDAAGTVRADAAEAAGTVRDEGRSAAGTVRQESDRRA
ncbi:DUF3618 domain-containing protein [Kineococcus gynurae]|uniref:DUF3618 domain-containing protein n=1 Tax=Kineococcus gynurae TaxID=452979 RepID=A0ABV5LVB3_9ACTN